MFKLCTSGYFFIYRKLGTPYSLAQGSKYGFVAENPVSAGGNRSESTKFGDENDGLCGLDNVIEV
jgi:hypothetical protein